MQLLILFGVRSVVTRLEGDVPFEIHTELRLDFNDNLRAQYFKKGFGQKVLNPSGAPQN